MKKYFSQRICVLSAFLSLAATALVSWLIMRVQYQRTPEYEEFVTGYTTWTGYFKQGDMTLANLVIAGILIFFVLFSVLLTLLSKRCSWLAGSFDRDREYKAGFHEKYEKAEFIVFLFLFSEFSLAAICKMIQMAEGGISWIETVFPYLQILVLIAAGTLSYLYIRSGKTHIMKHALAASQLFLPLCFLWIARYEYIRDGQVIVQYDFWKMKAAAAFCAGILLIVNIWKIFFRDRKKERPSVYLSSFLSLAVFASYTLPRGTISGLPLEMYHYGELSEPLHQLLNFGTVPYLDTMPIHGVCDYFQAAVWYLFYDGTYASFEPAMVMGCVVIALITAVVYYYFVENKLAALLCILLFSLFGDKYYYVRWAFALPFILIVFSKKVRKDFPRLLWCWTFISILSIAWNSSIGGALALAALPMVLWEGIHEKGWKIFLRLNEKEVRKKILPWYIPLLILGICFIPMFIAILRYIVENSQAILETTGDMLMEELVSPFVWYATFGFVFSLFAALIYLAGKKGEEKKIAAYALIFLFLFNIIIIRYTFVRTQFGERGIIVTTICSLFLLLMVFLPSLRRKPSVCTLVMTVFLFACTVWSKGSNLLTMPANVFAREEITEEYVYAAAEETGIEGLGDIYITEEQKEELMNLNELANDLCADLKFVDMTNQLSHYNILDKKNLLPFSSTYNTNNKVMQTRAIEVLKEEQPEIIAVYPAWIHDSGSLSTRNYYLYQYLAANYTPCKYKNIIFLTNSDEVREQFEPAYEELGEIMHIERLGDLPLVWGNEYLEEQETEDLPLEMNLVDTNAEKLGGDEYLLSAEESYFLYSFDENQTGMEIPFLRITVEDQSGSEEELQFEGVVYFMDEGKGVKESHRFIFEGGEGSFLIPLTTSPWWSYSDQIQSMMIDFISSSLPGKQISVTLEFETLKESEG